MIDPQAVPPTISAKAIKALSLLASFIILYGLNKKINYIILLHHQVIFFFNLKFKINIIVIKFINLNNYILIGGR